MKVKRSMAAIKLVLDERKKIDALLEMEILSKVDSKDTPKA